LSRLVPAIEREIREAIERRELHAREAALLESRERMEFALDMVGVGTWESRVDGRMIWSNVTERMHGFELGTFPGTLAAFVEAIYPDDRAVVVERISQPTDARIEYRTIWPDGSLHWLLGIGRSLFDERGDRIRAVGVCMDITAQKRLEEQFRQAQKMESIGNLAGGIAHDFNNLLTVISGFCELEAERPGLDARTVESLEAIRNAAASATALTRQLLTFSRRQIVMPRLLDLNETVEGFRKILRRLVEENVRLEFSLASTLGHVRADPGQIEQLLLNLVANARDAMPDGGSVTIRTRQVAAPAADGGVQQDVPAGPYVTLSVVDTGSGMTPEVRAHLFEPFFTTKPVGRGTGLGLATVHSIVKESGGYITVHSEPAVGTTFTIYLPVDSSETQAQAVAVASEPSDFTGNETILLIEDNAPLRRMTERMLQRYGYHVLQAATGEQARQMFSEHQGRISVVLTDIVMPDGSGPSIVAWIRERSPTLSVIYMSGYAADTFESAGDGHTFLPKPFTPVQLGRVIREVLGRS
jgi:two-component system cell cycle sensor histidine kinase/response regulator CckA